MGTMGQIEGRMNENKIYYTPFGKETEEIDLTKLTSDFRGHGGGDGRMVQQFYEYVVEDVKSPSITGLDISMESHYMALAAEQSRLQGGLVIKMDTYR